MNLYANLKQIKSPNYLNVDKADYDEQLLGLLEEGSRQVDIDTERFFYIYEGTFYQDGGADRVILDWDIQTVSTLKCDTDGDGTYEDSYDVDINSPTTAADAFCYPLNIYPKTRLVVNPDGEFGGFASGVSKGVEIVGTFGYGNDYPKSYLATTNLVASDCTSTAVTITVSTGGYFSAGQTLKIDSEQVYIYAPEVGNTLYVTRAINGTTAASHTASTTIYTFQYPRAITSAVLIYAMRLWKRKESAFQNTVASPELGGFTVWKGNDPDYQKTINKYKKVKIGHYG